jgi:hypothetical protein
MRPSTTRVVALGASNLTRGFRTVVSTARAIAGPDVEVLAALGHGRSYGLDSRILVRTLPGILQSGLWPRLESLPYAPTRGLVTDVGNDVLYGMSADRILTWVDEAVARLQRVTDDIILTDLPMSRARQLSGIGFFAVRTILVPQCRLTLSEVLDTAARVNDGLETIAAKRRIEFFHLKREWYGLDPIHIRPRLWRSAWHQILCGDQATPLSAKAGSQREAVQLYFMKPERQWLFGREQFTAQDGISLAPGGRVWLY